MESERIHVDSDEPVSSSHKLFRGIMLSFLITIIIIGYIALAGIEAFAQNPPAPGTQVVGGIPEDRSAKVAEVKEALELEEDIVLPTDGFRYVFKLWGEGFREAFTFDKVEKEVLNVKLIDERAREMAILSAQGVMIPVDVVEDYNDRIDQASRFVQLQTDANENIDRRTEVRTALEEHKKLILDRIETEPSNTELGKIIDDFRQQATEVITKIDEQEVAEVRNTLPIIREKQMAIRVHEMTGNVDEIKRIMTDLEEIDEKLNRLHLAKLCTSPIKTLSLDTARDVVQLCPIARMVEGQLQDEIDQVDAELERKRQLELERQLRLGPDGGNVEFQPGG